jgi:hypothetical protein
MKANRTIILTLDAESVLDNLTLIAVCARLLSDWDYLMGHLLVPTWVGPDGESELMSDREVACVKAICAMLDGEPVEPMRVHLITHNDST